MGVKGMGMGTGHRAQPSVSKFRNESRYTHNHCGAIKEVSTHQDEIDSKKEVVPSGPRSTGEVACQ